MTSEVQSRRRRPYKKSVRGCRNCKLRRVKCDETKPHCHNCSTYGVVCNYVSSNTPDLHVSAVRLHGRSANGCGHRSDLQARHYEVTPLPSIVQTTLKPIVFCSDGRYEFRMDGRCFAGLERFGAKAIPPYSWEVTKIWREDVPRFAFSNPYLMHTLLAVAAAHERLHEMAEDAQRTLNETYHTARAISLFNQKLSSRLTPADYDPLWATAALLGLLSSSAIDTLPENSWPLTTPSPSDLEWFILTDGKKAVWALTNPLRPSSVFSSVAQEYAAWDVPIPASGVGSIDARLASLCGITESSSAENNPYYAGAHMLSILQALNSNAEPSTHESLEELHIKTTGTEDVAYVSQHQVQHISLLKQRDKVSLVLLALWYERCEGVCWWLDRRARTEGLAIRLFLKQNYPDDKAISELLPILDSRDRFDVTGRRENATVGLQKRFMETLLAWEDLRITYRSSNFFLGL
ncbi:hypothetical protein DPSP01_004509 [Paraphaeosphaeria sporulosa]|uniref:Zn(2)-C6 fungal-type domain-containing protein n=1 Tax=Paraphaeosphaeria sporulosa TaxID=1460663 RepID=A0A177CRJ2_9PLEO|nr:uncharacterized protein CC84DRAFT_455123 [Paraphaeosphaeria sporulosa]OAG09831.1 hypothetical protein CC84DRAFT_455123 [Paraphaeosphaeria sporulosa]